jgi:YggT family protein
MSQTRSWLPPVARPSSKRPALSAVITYINALFIVFTIVILLRIVLSFFTIAPVRRSTQAIYDFIIGSTEWYLRIFRRFIPPLGMFDLSPIVAFIVLGILQQLITNLLNGF